MLPSRVCVGMVMQGRVRACGIDVDGLAPTPCCRPYRDAEMPAQRRAFASHLFSLPRRSNRPVRVFLGAHVPHSPRCRVTHTHAHLRPPTYIIRGNFDVGTDPTHLHTHTSGQT